MLNYNVATGLASIPKQHQTKQFRRTNKMADFSYPRLRAASFRSVEKQPLSSTDLTKTGIRMTAVGAQLSTYPAGNKIAQTRPKTIYKTQITQQRPTHITDTQTSRYRRQLRLLATRWRRVRHCPMVVRIYIYRRINLHKFEAPGTSKQNI